MVQKFRFGKERYIKLIIFGSDRKKKWWNTAIWQKKVKYEKSQGLQHRGGGSWK